MPEESKWIMDFHKYLKCPKCAESGLCCKPHKIEVENILNQHSKKKYT